MGSRIFRLNPGDLFPSGNVQNMEKISRIREKLPEDEKDALVLITKKKKVVAHAKWIGGDLIITKIRRPEKTNLQIGQRIYENWQLRESKIPPRPELRIEGWQLIRNQKYDSEKAKRPDPFWESYEGWFLIPEKMEDSGGLNSGGLEEFLREYPELRESGYEVLRPEEINQADLRMAEFSQVDAYVCGWSETLPELKPFQVPDDEDVVSIRGALCYCGCGKFERWHTYWENKWIIYVPRKGK